MSSILEITPVPYDPLLEKVKEMTKQPDKPFGNIFVGPKCVMLPKPYAHWADKILNMEIRKDDIWIVSIPRSGTTWTEEMVWLLSNNLDFETAKKKVLHKRFMYLELASMRDEEKLLEEFPTVDMISNAESPRLIKTHLSPELLPKQLWTVKPKIIYVYRNPKDVVISQYHFFSMMNGYGGTFEELAEIFLQNKCVYCPFWSHVLDFWELQKKQDILFLSYENMKEDLLSNVYKTADYLRMILTEEQAQKLTEHLDFKNMKNNDAVNMGKQLISMRKISNPQDANFIRKGCSGEWKEKMTPEIISKFDEWSKKYIINTDFKFYE